MVLHTLNKPPSRPELDTCIRFIGENDALILIEDGVYAATRARQGKLDGLIGAGIPVYAVEADVAARGLSQRLREEIRIVDYAGFVDLCTNYRSIKSWF